MTTRGRPARRRDQMLEYIRSTIERDGVAPSYGMICTAIGIATRQEVSRMVQAAEETGAIKRVGNGKVRRIRLACPLAVI